MNTQAVDLKEVVSAYVKEYGSLRMAAELLCIDYSYLSRLASGSKTNPSDEVLEKLGLTRHVEYRKIVREYKASELVKRSKCA